MDPGSLVGIRVSIIRINRYRINSDAIFEKVLIKRTGFLQFGRTIGFLGARTTRIINGTLSSVCNQDFVLISGDELEFSF